MKENNKPLIIPNKVVPKNTVPGTNTNSNYTVSQLINSIHQQYINRPRNMDNIAAERAISNRQQRTAYDRAHGQGTYNAQQSNKNTQIDILKSKQEDRVAQIAGGAANGIDATMGILSMVPGANLSGDTYFAMKGAKDLSQGNYLGATLNTLPIGASVLGRGLDVATPYIKTGLNNLSNTVGNGLERTSQLYKPLRYYRFNRLLRNPIVPSGFSEFPDNSFTQMYPYNAIKLGQYFRTTNPHTNVVTGLTPLNEKPVIFFQSDVPGSYYNKMATQIRNKDEADQAKLGLHFMDAKKMDDNDLLDFITDGSQNIKDTPINKLLWDNAVDYFKSQNYINRINKTVGYPKYEQFIQEYLPSAFNNNSIINLSSRLMKKYNPGSSGYHFQIGRNGSTVLKDFANQEPDYAIPTYFHEVGGHGTEGYFGLGRTADPTGVSQTSMAKVNSSTTVKNEVSEHFGEDYYTRPNEMRARALATNMFIHMYPKRAGRLFDIDYFGDINRVISDSQPGRLFFGSFKKDWSALTDYLHNAYKQGGKL